MYSYDFGNYMSKLNHIHMKKAVVADLSYCSKRMCSYDFGNYMSKLNHIHMKKAVVADLSYC